MNKPTSITSTWITRHLPAVKFGTFSHAINWYYHEFNGNDTDYWWQESLEDSIRMAADLRDFLVWAAFTCVRKWLSFPRLPRRSSHFRWVSSFRWSPHLKSMKKSLQRKEKTRRRVFACRPCAGYFFGRQKVTRHKPIENGLKCSERLNLRRLWNF